MINSYVQRRILIRLAPLPELRWVRFIKIRTKRTGAPPTQTMPYKSKQKPLMFL